MWKLRRISLFFMISCMLSVLCGCGASGEQETITEHTNSGINADMEAVDNNSGSNETGRKKNDSSESDNTGNNDTDAETA